MTRQNKTLKETLSRLSTLGNLGNIGAGVLFTVFTVLAVLLAVGSILLAFSCAPATPDGGNGDPTGPTAPGAVTNLVEVEASRESTSFVVQWAVPEVTGTKADGTALGFGEIGYRIYYLAESAGQTTDQTTPSAESIRKNGTPVQVPVPVQVGTVLRATIEGLTPDTRYFVTIVSYNTTAPQLAETISAEVFEVTTLVATVVVTDFEGELSYAKTEYTFAVGSNNTITPDGIPTIPSTDSSGTRIDYSITRSTETEPVSESDIAIDGSGVVTINQVSDVGTATYVVRAEATGYNAQEVMLDIVVTMKVDFEGELSYAKTEYTFAVGSNNTITPDGTPTIPSTDSSGATIGYSITRSSETELVPESAIAIDESGVIVVTINQVSDVGTATYVVRAEATGYNAQEVTLKIVVAMKVNFEGELSYESSYDLTIGINKTITPDGIPTIPSTDSSGTRINYSLEKREGTDFDFNLSVIEGTIIIKQIRNVGSARYVMQASATGYNAQEVMLDIVVVEADFEGELSYKTSYEFIVGSENTITPTSKLVIPGADTSDITIRYILTRSMGTVMFDPEPRINENNGTITVSPISVIGEASYVVQVKATNYNTQEATLRISTVGNANVSMLQVSTYYSAVGEATDILPVALGQAIEDNGMFSLTNNDVILNVPNLSDGSYTVYFGSEPGSYGAGYQKVVSTGNLQLLKLELTTNSFSFVDGAVIGISGPGITGTQHVATYHPSQIYNHQDLQAMRIGLSRDYILKKDLVFPSPTGTSTSNYEAVGDDENPFTGSLNGMGHSITGIEIVSTDNEQGLFGVVEGGRFSMTIAQSLVLRNFKITANSYVGSLAGRMKRGTVDAVHVEVSGTDTGKIEVSGSVLEGRILYSYAGGLIGRAGMEGEGTQARIRNTSSAVAVFGTGTDSNVIGGLVGGVYKNVTLSESHATGSMTGKERAGGLVGWNDGTVTGDSYATGSVTGTGEFLGGLVGHNTGTVTESYATGSVTGINSTGGLVGYNTGTVTESYATGSVTGTGKFLGGLVGHNTGTVTESYATGSGSVTGGETGDVTGSSRSVGGLVGFNTGTVTESYATVPVTGTGEFLGGLVGHNTGTVIESYATGSVTGESNRVGGLVGYNDDNGIVSGSATGSVMGINSTGGLVGTNNGTVTGYATGSVTGNGAVGGLVGFSTKDDTVTGYATGSVTGAESVGGLVGWNNGTATGYATGSVIGDSYVGGLVGNSDDGFIRGYARGVVRRASGTGLSFGKTIGDQHSSATVYSYHSTTKSKIYDGAAGTIVLAGVTGDDGTAVTIDSSTEATFSDLDFGISLGEWTWVANGKWPAINIGDVKPASEQPVDPVD